MRPRGLVRLLVTHNPFYVISAGLILFGLYQAHATWAHGNWALLGVLGGYAALMAGAGALIVRVGRVWEDARSILLIVVGILLATSVGFDAITVSRESSATPQLLVGLGLAIALSEAMLTAIGIRLHTAARLPYHAALALFFLYPVLLATVVGETHGGNKVWLALAIYGWPVCAGLIALSLLPAARMGRALGEDSGTPWRWPMFPWVLFALLGVAAALRTWLFCISFYTGAQDPFGVYMLAPLLLPVGLLMLESGLRTGQRRAVRLGMAMPLIAVLASFPGSNGNPVRQELLHFVKVVLGSPVWLAAGAAVCFYTLAWLRGVRSGEPALLAATLGFACVGPTTVSVQELQPQQVPALTVLGGYLLVSLLWSPRSWRALLATLCLSSGPISLVLPWVGWQHALGMSTLAVVVVLSIALVFDDALAYALRVLTLPLMSALLIGALFFAERVAPGWPSWVLWPYAVALVLLPLAFGYWRLACAHLALLLMRLLVAAVLLHLRPDLPAGLIALFWSGVFFVVAVCVSLAKSPRLVYTR